MQDNLSKNSIVKSKDNFKRLKHFINRKIKEVVATSAVAILILSFVFGFTGGVLGVYFAPNFVSKYDSVKNIFKSNKTQKEAPEEYIPQTTTERAVIEVVKNASSSVVSVIATKDVPIIERYYLSPFGNLFPQFKIPQYRQKGTEEKQVSTATGFVMGNNLIATNKHVVEDLDARYIIITPEGKQFSAEVIERDTEEDVAILKTVGLGLVPLKLGNSDTLSVGQSVIAIGNALGEFENSVSAGIVSGLSRTLTAGTGNGREVLREVIQTDAAINFGNSGGPLLNLRGEVIGINVAKAINAENIGFAIPINKIKK